MMLDRPNPLHILVLTSATDARDRAALLTPVLDHARAVVQVHRMPEGGDLNCGGDLPNTINTPNIIVLFHGGIRTAARIKALQKRFNCPVVLRLGGRNDLAALDLARGAVGSLRMGKALRHVANAALDRRTLRAADGCICVTGQLEKWVQSKTHKPVLACPPIRQLDVLPRLFKQDQTELRIVTTANLKYRAKVDGVLRLLPLFERFVQAIPQAIWQIIGNGPGLQRLHHAISLSPASNSISCIGWSDCVQKHLQHANQFWYASTLDAYPLSVSEAMWSSVPVIVEQDTPAASMVPVENVHVCDNSWTNFAIKLAASADLQNQTTAKALSKVKEMESLTRLGNAFAHWSSQFATPMHSTENHHAT